MRPEPTGDAGGLPPPAPPGGQKKETEKNDSAAADYTPVLRNRSTRFALPSSGLSRLIPELEKT